MQRNGSSQHVALAFRIIYALVTSIDPIPQSSGLIAELTNLCLEVPGLITYWQPPNLRLEVSRLITQPNTRPPS
jgi:hypothetical protein